MTDSKITLTIIQSTHASLIGMEQSGLLDRHKRLLDEYRKHFHVVLYTSDSKDYSTYLNVQHRHLWYLPPFHGLRHLVFYIWLVFQSFQMRGVIKVFGSNIPTLPLVKKLSRCPMMVTYQFDYAGLAELTYGKGIRAWLSHWMEYLAIKPADMVAVTTSALETKIKKVYRKDTTLLPNWVFVDQLIQNRPGEIRESNMILYAGRLHQIKGIEALIQAVFHTKQTYPDVRLVICGTGEEYKKLECMANSLNLNVEFRGKLSNSAVVNLMCKTTIFVLPTLTMEGHPKALIEAMTYGCACIASDVPGNNDLITNGENGLLTPAGDSVSLSKAIIKLLENESLRAKLAKSAKEKAKQFNWDIVVENDLQILKQMSELSQNK